MNASTEICEIPEPLDAVAQTQSRSRLGDYYELIKPRMNLLILGTTTVGYFMAQRQRSGWAILPHALIGTALCAAGAAILNQLVEMRYDALMPRTRNRPLPTGRIAPREALWLGLATSIVGGLYLLFMVNALTAALGVATLASYVLVYTPLKRLTTLNTIIGAIPGAIPPVMGWTAVTGSFSTTAAILFGILFIWQVPHFMAIATLYREDYRVGGFKMLPVSDPTLSATSRQILLYTAALLPVSFAPALLGIAGAVYAVAAVVLGAAFAWFAISCAIRRTRTEARKLFFASIIYLPVLLFVLMLDRF